MDVLITKPRSILKPSLKSLDERMTGIETGMNHLGGEVAEMNTDIKCMQKLISGDNGSGMLERLRSIERDIATVKKVGMTTFIILLGIVVTQLYNVLMTHFSP